MPQEFALPELYGPWIAELLPGPIPQETKATCQECAMCARERPADGLMFFDSKVKCCTYEPRLSNFLVGRILADEAADPAGRASVLDRMARRIAVSPLGLDSPPRDERIPAKALHAFGRDLALRCPHYLESPDGGRCGIWTHRNSVCTTWFCKHVRGRAGQEFWARLKELLGAIEFELSLWCVIKLEAVTQELLQWAKRANDHPDPDGLEGPIDLSRYSRLWGTWSGREREFYEACAERVSTLNWTDVTRLCGPQVSLRAHFAREAFHQMTSSEVPARLRLKGPNVISAQDGKMLVETYSSFDPLLMPERLGRALPYFTGQPWQEAVEAIRAKLGMQLDRKIIGRLVDFGILVECEETSLNAAAPD